MLTKELEIGNERSFSSRSNHKFASPRLTYPALANSRAPAMLFVPRSVPPRWLGLYRFIYLRVANRSLATTDVFAASRAAASELTGGFAAAKEYFGIIAQILGS